MNKVIQQHSIRKDTSTYTWKDLMDEIKEDVAILKSLGYDCSRNTYNVGFINNSYKMYGFCSKVHGTPDYNIKINYKYLRKCKPEEIHCTIMHEVIHSVPECMDHGSKWKKIASEVNANYNFLPIKTTNSYDDWAEITQGSYRYFAKCDNCGYTYKWIRASKYYYACKSGNARCKCGSDKFVCSDYLNKTI